MSETLSGNQTFEGTVTLGADDVEAYGSLSGDRNLLHFDDEFARSVGLPGRIVHGMFVLAQVMEMVEGWYEGEVTTFGCRFSRPLTVGGTLTVGARSQFSDETQEISRIEITATSAAGERVLSHAAATIRNPRAGD